MKRKSSKALLILLFFAVAFGAAFLFFRINARFGLFSSKSSAKTSVAEYNISGMKAAMTGRLSYAPFVSYDPFEIGMGKNLCTSYASENRLLGSPKNWNAKIYAVEGVSEKELLLCDASGDKSRGDLYLLESQEEKINYPGKWTLESVELVSKDGKTVETLPEELVREIAVGMRKGKGERYVPEYEYVLEDRHFELRYEEAPTLRFRADIPANDYGTCVDPSGETRLFLFPDDRNERGELIFNGYYYETGEALAKYYDGLFTEYHKDAENFGVKSMRERIAEEIAKREPNVLSATYYGLAYVTPDGMAVSSTDGQTVDKKAVSVFSGAGQAENGPTLILCPDGTVDGKNRTFFGPAADDWRNAVKIDGSIYGCACLTVDGRVRTWAKSYSSDKGFDYSKHACVSWRNVTDVGVFGGPVVCGLFEDGRVLADYDGKEVLLFENVQSICCGDDFAAALTKNGNVAFWRNGAYESHPSAKWRNIVRLFACGSELAAIDKDGKIYYSGSPDLVPEGIQDVVAVSGCKFYTAWMTSDGRITLCGKPPVQAIADTAARAGRK